jgi:hypothetical protein
MPVTRAAENGITSSRRGLYLSSLSPDEGRAVIMGRISSGIDWTATGPEYRAGVYNGVLQRISVSLCSPGVFGRANLKSRMVQHNVTVSKLS